MPNTKSAAAGSASLTLLRRALNQQEEMSGITKQAWGALPSGERIDLYTLRNPAGVEVAITNYGGRIVTLRTPDRDGNLEDIVLGFDRLEEYLRDNPFFGALVGRYANRIANGEFALNGKTYKLARNNGENSLHGGLRGFDKVAWDAREVSDADAPGLELKYGSRDGEEGFPGNLSVTVLYTLTENNELKIEYGAVTDADTVINLTNHSYFDLSGHAAGNILEHRLTINADTLTPVNANLIPTGELRSVAGTPFDFRQPTAIGERIDGRDEQLGYGEGYDHNFVVNRDGKGLALAARVSDPESGRVMEVLTTQPGIQFYTGNHLPTAIKGKEGAIYGVRSGFCLETQHFPDSPNQPKFSSAELKAGERYRETTIFRFSSR